MTRITFELGVDKDGEFGYFIPGTGIAGLKLKLKAVKLLSLKVWGERDANSYGMGGEEDGDDIEDIDARDDADDGGVADDSGASDDLANDPGTPDF